MAPAALLEAGRTEVCGYGVQVLDGRVDELASTGSGFTVGLEDGRRVGARRLLVTTGLVDELPDVAGVRERWGRDVLHCPYCHGWEVRDRPLGVLGTSSRAVHQALLFRQWTDDLTLFVHTAPPPTDDEAEQLAARGIAVVHAEVAALEVAEDRLVGVRLRSGKMVALQALTVMPRFAARAGMLSGLGIHAAAHPTGVGEQVEADATGRTAVPGVWVAGNVTDVVAGVTGAADTGVRAAAAINADLIEQETRDAVAAYRARGPAAIRAGMFGQAFWDARYASSDAIWSGAANRHLVASAAELEPGRALDVGSGEGADDLAGRARVESDRKRRLSRGAAARRRPRGRGWGRGGEAHRLAAAGRAGLGSRALVLRSRQRPVHAPAARTARGVVRAPRRRGGARRDAAHRRPPPSDLETTVPRGSNPDLLFTASEVAALLDSEEWEVVVEGAPERTIEDPDDNVVTIRDALLLARRRG